MLVGAAEATGNALGMSEQFLGIVVLAVLGGAAELGAAVAMARKNEMDLSVGIAMGSSIQIGLFVTPVLVLASLLVADERLTLSFTRLEIGALVCSVLVGVVVASDGRANWFKGVQLLALYGVIPRPSSTSSRAEPHMASSERSRPHRDRARSSIRRRGRRRSSSA